MALFKIGKTFVNGLPKDNYLLQGRAIKDGETSPVNGKEHSRVSVVALETEQGETIFVTLNGWRERTPDVAAVRKGDAVFAIGTLSTREYNGKTYYDLDANFCITSGTGRGITRGVDVLAEALGGEPAVIEEEDATLPF